ncbi:MAG: sortase [Dehalococcoidia bacterium]
MQHGTVAPPLQLTAREAAVRLGVTSADIIRWIEAGRLQANRYDSERGAVYSIPEDALERLRDTTTGAGFRGRRLAPPHRLLRILATVLLFGGLAAVIVAVAATTFLSDLWDDGGAPTSTAYVGLPAPADAEAHVATAATVADSIAATPPPAAVPLPEIDAEQLIHGGSGAAGANLAGPGIVAAIDNPTGWEIVIPSARIRADIVGLGITARGALGAPDNPDVVGWWQDGPAPGERGNVLFDGHRDFTDVDGNVGTGVAWQLPDVAVGDPILVLDRASGVTHVYLVTQTFALPFDDPDGARVLAASSDARLTLITCEGSFDRSLHNYSQRRIVIAIYAGSADELAL